MPWAAWSKPSNVATRKKKLPKPPTSTSGQPKPKRKVIVGANEFVIEEEPLHILYIDENVAREQSAKLKALRARRSNEEVQRRLEALKKAAAQEPKSPAGGETFFGQYHALHRRRRPRLRHGRRNLRSAPRSFRDLHGSEHHLEVIVCSGCVARTRQRPVLQGI